MAELQPFSLSSFLIFLALHSETDQPPKVSTFMYIGCALLYFVLKGEV